MIVLAGKASDEVDEVLATGRCGVTSVFVSMSGRHPDGKDADHLRWHTFDHRPEQYRLASVRASLRLVSTPECRAVRATSIGRYDAVDHVMTYFFADVAGLDEFNQLAIALGRVGRIPPLLPFVERGVYRLEGMKAAPRVKIGADVLPWWPLRGGYLLVERGHADASDLAALPGVAGVWWGETSSVDPTATADGLPYSTAEAGMQITYCFLDDDPVVTARRLPDALEERWADASVTPFLAAPFYPVIGYDCDRHLP
jgi:hypothetical protein